MQFICGKCGQRQALDVFSPVSPDPDEPHRVWDARCVGCGFSGKSRVSPMAWRQLVEAETRNGGRPFPARLRYRLRSWNRRGGRRGWRFLGGETR